MYRLSLFTMTAAPKPGSCLMRGGGCRSMFFVFNESGGGIFNADL
jgi:hypothetical protein